MNKKNKKFDKICKAIVLKNGVSMKEVKKEMQSAINYAFENVTQEQKLFQSNITKKGEIPTPEELLNFVCKNIK
ncbi:sporulation initiation factor Spo0A C-terminal domain-containing protein [Clostridium sp. MD294]|uniref:sporulation initiation factor Spo0A C-terminal domain-containing protein n=1 Tax=Clostridium sp. MD294 TaxID=97138 RepID=UPI0002CC51D4|nr:sporulation initiation factor Spo0A C-terminal domain-containing protein [Clostridium sp. MD294]USF29787.1 hypothetical protein C820_001195 [Clostridium sp. MD294]